MDSPGTVRVFVDGRGVDAPSDGTVLDAVRSHDADAAERVETGLARLTDSRGLPIDASAPVHGGAILRVLPVRAARSETPELEPGPDAWRDVD